jgi:hypothetical protein
MSLDQTQADAAVQLLRSFIAAMNVWEKAAYAAFRKSRKEQIPVDPSLASDLAAIFSKHCENPVPARGVRCRHPPEYDPEFEPVVEVIPKPKGRLVIVTQQQTGFRAMCRYTMVSVAGQWKISRRAFIDDGKEVKIDI